VIFINHSNTYIFSILYVTIVPYVITISNFLFMIIIGIARRCLKRIYFIYIYIKSILNRGQKLYDTEAVSVFDFTISLKSVVKYTAKYVYGCLDFLLHVLRIDYLYNINVNTFSNNYTFSYNNSSIYEF
jgi:hypothetical protein